jgi:hypothetical protein
MLSDVRCPDRLRRPLSYTLDYSADAHARELRDDVREAAALACTLGAACDFASGHVAVFDRLLSRYLDARERDRPFGIHGAYEREIQTRDVRW